MIDWIKKLWEIWLFKYHKWRGCEIMMVPFDRGTHFWISWDIEIKGYVQHTTNRTRYQVKAKKNMITLVEEKSPTLEPPIL